MPNEFFPNNKPSPDKDAQMDLPLEENSSQKTEHGAEEVDLNWGPQLFETNEKIDPEDYHSEYVDKRVELKDGIWFVDYEKVSYKEAREAISPGLGVLLKGNDEKFKKIYEYFENLEK